jgi:hypothetical protein
VPGTFNQDTAHGRGGSREKVTAIVPARIIGRPNQAQVRLMDQGSGVQGLAGRFPGQSDCCQLAKLVIHQRQQLTGCLRVASVEGGQDSRYFTHGPLPEYQSVTQ